jgi:hypothetical protein
MMPRFRRRWIVLGIALVVALATVRLLYQPLALESYRVLDPQTLVVIGYGAPGACTRVSGVSETDSTVTVSVDAFTFQPFPGTALAARLEISVPLGAPLGARSVIDGSTGQEVPETSE